MVIRTIQEEDYEQLVDLYKSFFPTHNIFSQGKDIVIAYLRKEALEREDLLVFEKEEIIKGALIIVLLGKSSDNSHCRWKFRHFAFKDEEAAKELLEAAERRIKDSSKTAKIELTIAENEQGIDFYKNNGYEQEAELKNHYRCGEKCLVFGKSFE